MASGFTQARRAALAGAALAVIWALPAVAQSGSAGSAPVVLSRKVASKLLLSQPKPEYPAPARVNYIQGRVRMEITVGRDGRVSAAHALTGHPFLAAAALKTVRKWVYKPFVTSAGPAPFETDVDVNFALRMKDLSHVPPAPQRDLQRQVQPPALLGPAAAGSSSELVHLRVLVSADGSVLDLAPVDGANGSVREAEKDVRRWKFRPAHWGNLAVPWYMDVAVPLDDPGHEDETKPPSS